MTIVNLAAWRQLMIRYRFWNRWLFTFSKKQIRLHRSLSLKKTTLSDSCVGSTKNSPHLFYMRRASFAIRRFGRHRVPHLNFHLSRKFKLSLCLNTWPHLYLLLLSNWFLILTYRSTHLLSTIASTGITPCSGLKTGILGRTYFLFPVYGTLGSSQILTTQCIKSAGQEIRRSRSSCMKLNDIQFTLIAKSVERSSRLWKLKEVDMAAWSTSTGMRFTLLVVRTARNERWALVKSTKSTRTCGSLYQTSTRSESTPHSSSSISASYIVSAAGLLISTTLFSTLTLLKSFILRHHFESGSLLLLRCRFLLSRSVWFLWTKPISCSLADENQKTHLKHTCSSKTELKATITWRD